MADGQPLPPKLTLQLLRRQDGQRSFPTGPGSVNQDQDLSALLRENGTFALKAPQDSSYTLFVKGAGSYLVMGAAASGGEATANDLHIGQKPITLAATIAPAESSISGLAMKKGQPEAGAVLLLVPDDAAAESLYREDETNSDGSWHVTGVAAGRYRAVAIRDGWDLAWKQPGVLAKYLQAGGIALTVDGRSPVMLEQPLQALDR